MEDIKTQYNPKIRHSHLSNEFENSDETNFYNQLTNDEMPKHTHTTNVKGSHSHEFIDDHADQDEKIELSDDENRGLYELVTTTGYTEYAGEHTHTLSNDGGDVPHENRPSYYVMAFIIRVK